MKKILTLLFCVCMTVGYAQIVTPGTGDLYTLSSFVNDPSGAVTSPQSGHYVLTQDLTISANDTLLLNAATSQLQIEGAVTITIAGKLLCQSRDDMLEITGVAAGSDTLFELRFEEAASSVLSNLNMSYGEGIFIGQSTVLIEDCEFSNFNKQVIRYMNCSPIIRRCNFHDNQMAAINSAVNVLGAPVITDNTFTHNVLSNVNQPQINLGPSGENSVILIENNIIEGISPMSGGIAVADLMGVGSTRVVLRNNTITNNRYGYNQQGSNILALIENNRFIDNNLETNPMNGGSGISIYGTDTTCVAKLRGNLITGSLWGITAINYHKIDMGTENDYGNNAIYDNGNDGVTYALYNNAHSSMYAIGNYWGGEDEEFAESVIFHRPDLGEDYGLVLFSPVLSQNPVEIADNKDVEVNVYPNPASENVQIQFISSPSGSTEIQLFDFSGRVVKCVQAVDNTTLISLSNLPSGIYLLNVVSDGKVVAVKKVVKW